MNNSKKSLIIICIILALTLSLLTGIGAFSIIYGLLRSQSNEESILTNEGIVQNAESIPSSSNSVQTFSGNTGSTAKTKDSSYSVYKEDGIDILCSYIKMEKPNFEIKYAASVDVSDIPGNETIFVGSANGDYCAYIATIHKGKFYFSDALYNALYLVNHNGKSHVISYCLNSQSDGSASYSYTLYRFNDQCKGVSISNANYNYHPSQQNATPAANFFNKFKSYTNDIKVIIDPYRLTGRQWLLPSESIYGTPPAEKGDIYTQKLGYVKIDDSNSWLNLREGPGTNYSCIYTDPNNKKSIVKQAQGSPVTILGTFHTNDVQNPVWYKIRITYAGREIIGYSSQRYIKAVN